MKYLLILFTILAIGQTDNQMVTFTQASNLGFNLKSGQSNVTSNQCMTKSAALAKYNLNANFMSEYIDNQLVPRSTWVNNSFQGVPFFTNFTTYNNNSEACNETSFLGDTRYTISGLAVGVKIFSDEACTQEITILDEFRVALQGENKFSFRGGGANNTISTLFNCTQ
jgi:hypothetical protein